MPSAEIWTLFPALGVVVLLLVIIGVGARTMWREYRAFMEVQDKKRDDERDKQRSWEENQDALRDGRWQGFITAMKIEQAKENEADRISIANLAVVIEGMRKAVEQLTLTLRNHILEDDARFDVLLRPEQKSAIEDVKTQPRKKP
jgi:flagellar biosynthesis/type III secretory pathway M-ring protein FliF/YscJ